MTDDPGYDLVLPFVTVKSKGGPHDDDAYTCGWEMGSLDAHLNLDLPMGADRTIHTVNRQQADLIAMRHGYVMTVVSDDGEWLHAEFTYDCQEPS